MKKLRPKISLLIIIMALLQVSGLSQQPAAIDLGFNPLDIGLNMGAPDKINSMVLQPDGKILIGGFTSNNGTNRNYIARLNPDGSLDAGFYPGAWAETLDEIGGEISTMVLQPDSKILIGGSFTIYGDTPRNGIARLNADGNRDEGFNPGRGAGNMYGSWGSKINSMVLQPDGKILIGGDFTTYNGSIRNKIARLNADGSLDAGFNPGTGANNVINSIVLQPDGKILIGGGFTSYNGTTRNKIARLNADGSLDGSFNPGAGVNESIGSMVLLPNGKILIGGFFTSYNGTNRNKIARLNADGSLDAGFNPGTGVNEAIYSIVLQPDGKTIIGGSFTTYNGTTRNRIARLNADGGLDGSFIPDTGANESVNSIVLQSDGKILIGGSFSEYNGTGKNRIARLLGESMPETWPLPTISTFTPISAGLGTAVTISGTNLSGVSAVTFGGFAASSFTGNSSTITAIVGAGASGNISVTTPGGTATQTGFTFIPIPTITLFSPSTAAGESVVTITGTDFTGATAVSFGGVSAKYFTVISSTTISAIVGTGATGNVSVTTAGGNATKVGFIFIPPPTIASIAPTSAGTGTQVTIAGTNFLGATAISFGGTPAASFTTINATTITAVVGAGASGNIIVTTPGGIATQTGFTFIPIPTITSFSPSTAAGESLVTITGTDFIGATAVSFGGTPAASFSVVNSTTITAVVGSGSTGNVSVTTAGGTTTKAGFTYIPVPTLTSFSPTTGGTGTNIFITGTNFTGATSVRFGGVSAASFDVISNTNIRAVVGSGASGSLSVTTPHGTDTLNGFNFILPPAITYAPNTYAFVVGSSITPKTPTNTGGAVAPPGSIVSTLAGGGQFKDGFGIMANFWLPGNVAVDHSGNVYVADCGNNRIRKIAPSGEVTTLAGSGYSGFTEGIGTSASFNYPNGVAVDGSGNVYVADLRNNRIRKINPEGVVSTLAGSGIGGYANGSGISANFSSPSSVAVDGSGNVYVADAGNNRIRKITPAGIVTTLAGSGNQAYADGTGTSASFFSPSGVAVDGSGNVYVADAGNNRIRKISSSGIITTIAGSGNYGYGDGTGTMASFKGPSGVAVDGVGNLYVADIHNHYIRKISPSGVVTTFAGSGNGAYVDGTGTAASFNYTAGVALDGSGNVYVADQWNHCIRKISPAGLVTTIAGSRSSGYADDIGIAASFNNPEGVSVDISGNIYVVDMLNHRIRKITPWGVVSTLAGNDSSGYVDGLRSVARFKNPKGIVVDNVGYLYVTDAGNNRIRKISPEGIVTTFSGSGQSGYADGLSEIATFRQPNGVVVDESGNIYIADENNHRIRKITSTGIVTTLAGSGNAAFLDGIGLAASFSSPSGLALDNVGNVFVADRNNHRIRKISPLGVVTTLVGSGIQGFSDGSGLMASFNNPSGVAVDGSGNAYVADWFNNRVRKVSPMGVVTTLAGSGVPGYAEGTGTTASFRSPRSVAVDLIGNVYVADAGNNRIRKLSPAGGYFISPALPPGLSLNAETGVISGTPTTAIPPTNYVVTATNAAGSSSFTVTLAIFGVPSLTTFTPTRAVSGTTVTITGTNLNGATAVSFGGVAAESFTVVSSTTITAKPGQGASGLVSVTTPGGTATASGFMFTGISSFSPAAAQFGQTVTLVGTNLNNTSAVTFGGVPALSFTNVSSTTLTAIVGNGASGKIAVTTPAGVATIDGFKFLQPPVVSGFSPTSATNRSKVIISGNFFNGVTAVRFGGVNAYVFTVINSNTIEAIVGPGNSGNITVVTEEGNTNFAGFVYLPAAPTISLFSPANTCTPGTLITVQGLNFTGTTKVQVGSLPAVFTIVSDTVITFSSGNTNNIGLLQITNAAGTATTTNLLTAGTGIPDFTTVLVAFQLCGGSPRLLKTTLPGGYQLECSNGQSGNTINIADTGSYTLTATDDYGCTKTLPFSVTSLNQCGGYLEIDATPVINYFDTLTVRVKVKDAVNIFSVFAYINFNPSHFKYVGAQAGDFFGTNIITQPPIAGIGQVDFGMSLFSGSSGINGDGLIYEFKFVLNDQIPNLVSFNDIIPNFFASVVSIGNIRVRNALGIAPPSFNSISATSQTIACRYFVPVWPGDLNFDRRVTVADVLPIGYFYGQTGPARPNGTFEWRAQPGALWGFDKAKKTNSAYRTFADAEPDGVINLADLGAVGFNLNKIRQNSAYFNQQQAPDITIDPNLPPIVLQMPRTQLAVSDLPTNEVGVLRLGTASKVLNNVYGVAFDIYFDPELVNISQIVTNYTNSIFGTEGVTFTKLEDRSGLASGRLSIGITKFNSIGFKANGGEVLKITLPLKSGSGGELKITVVPAGCNDPLGNELSVTGSEQTILIGCPTNTWTGAVSNAWEDTGNWSCQLVPTAVTRVVIPSNVLHYPIIRSMAVCRSLNARPGSTVVIDPGFGLEVKE